MSWERKVKKDYLQKLADEYCPGTKVTSADLAKSVYNQLNPPKQKDVFTTSVSGSVWIDDDFFTAHTKPVPKSTEWRFTNPFERRIMEIEDNEALNLVERKVVLMLKDMRKSYNQESDN